LSEKPKGLHMTLDDRIKASGKTTIEIAAKAGISRVALWKARGGAKIEWDTAHKIAMALGCKPSDIRPEFKEAAE
jgi:DNA-binding Xre family transcriptional regulator